MGMFDYINCERKLPLTKEIKKSFPNIDWAKAGFQTKDLENAMFTYCITKSGNLSMLKIEGEHVRTLTEEEENKKRKEGKFCWPYKFVEKSRKYEKTDHTGVVNFYYYGEDSQGNTWDLEFKATFVKGKIKDLVLNSGEIIRTAEESQADELRWREKHNAYLNHPWTKTKKILNKITFNYWATFWKNLSNIIGKTSTELSNLRFWIIRNMY
jgi:hypothetical protein